MSLLVSKKRKIQQYPDCVILGDHYFIDQSRADPLVAEEQETPRCGGVSLLRCTWSARRTGNEEIKKQRNAQKGHCAELGLYLLLSKHSPFIFICVDFFALGR